MITETRHTREKVQSEEIRPGLVAFIDLGAVQRHPLCKSYNPGGPKPHPCVCLHATARVALWGPLTTTYRPERLEIRREWKLGGTQSFQNKDIWLGDGACIFAIPNGLLHLFNDGEVTGRDTRGRISPEGMGRVLAEVSDRARFRRTP
jgi:hypothetical protein